MHQIQNLVRRRSLPQTGPFPVVCKKMAANRGVDVREGELSDYFDSSEEEEESYCRRRSMSLQTKTSRERERSMSLPPNESPLMIVVYKNSVLSQSNSISNAY